MRDKIAISAETLDGLLAYTPSQGECPVSRREAQAMWDAASELQGFAAVRAFLEVCKGIKPKDDQEQSK